jgi:AcrR family transcriptional regulator
MPRVSEEYFENKRKEILDAAYRVCVRKPLTSVVMKDIIDETGFSHGVIYKYYKDLDEVLTDLVIRINSENRIDEDLNAILDREGTKNWETAVRCVCDLLADSMKRVGRDMMKLSLYCDHLAMSDPERVNRIAVNLGKDGQSPLVYLVVSMDKYLRDVIKKEKLHPVKSVDEILQFIMVSFQGIQSGYVLSACFDEEQVNGKYLPEEMFSCLAESVILMIKG